jgi:hypothetical protein
MPPAAGVRPRPGRRPAGRGRPGRPRRSPACPAGSSHAPCRPARSPLRRWAPPAQPGGSRRSTGSACPGWTPRHPTPWSQAPGGSCRPGPRLVHHLPDRVEDPVRPAGVAQSAPPVGQRGRMQRRRRHSQPTRGFPPQVKPQRLSGGLIRQPVQGLQHQHRRDHVRRHRRSPSRGEQVSEHLIREQLTPMRGQERAKTPPSAANAPRPTPHPRSRAADRPVPAPADRPNPTTNPAGPTQPFFRAVLA